jgi:hypothetical protein
MDINLAQECGSYHIFAIGMNEYNKSGMTCPQ